MPLFFTLNDFNARRFLQGKQTLKTKILLYNLNCTTFAALSF
jgi:hypothetical protein